MKNHLIGTWRLISVEYMDRNNTLSYPYGRNPEGCLTYTEDGYMSVTIMNANRAKFASDDIRSGSVEEKVAAYESYWSYCGTYDFQGDKVIHHIRQSLFPNRINVDQLRFVKLEGNRLVLTTEPLLAGGTQQTGRLTWERI